MPSLTAQFEAFRQAVDPALEALGVSGLWFGEAPEEVRVGRQPYAVFSNPAGAVNGRSSDSVFRLAGIRISVFGTTDTLVGAAVEAIKDAIHYNTPALAGLLNVQYTGDNLIFQERDVWLGVLQYALLSQSPKLNG